MTTDHVIFLNELQQKGLTSDWLPFKQSKWSKEILHGDLPTDSRFAEGICNEICAWMMVKWVKEGPSSDYIAQLYKASQAEMIVELADARKSAPTYCAIRLRLFCLSDVHTRNKHVARRVTLQEFV